MGIPVFMEASGFVINYLNKISVLLPYLYSVILNSEAINSIQFLNLNTGF